MLKMKASEQYFHVVLVIMLYKVVLIYECAGLSTTFQVAGKNF